MSLTYKIEKIIDAIRSKKSVIIAFSGGVDSSVLAALSFKALENKAIAVTADSQTLARDELEIAKKVAKEIGIKHIIISYDELNEPEFKKNPINRCYFCKKGLFRELKKVAKKYDVNTILDGTNISELNGHRPGFKAVIEEGVYTPFVEFEVTKKEIRDIAKMFGLSVAEKPSMACLSSRFPYGEIITSEALKKVEIAEKFLRDKGFEIVRVRVHKDIARIEIETCKFSDFLNIREYVVSEFKKLGFLYITLDLMGYRSGGSFNDVIEN